MEALRDECIVKLIKVDTAEDLADLNSKLLNVVRFEYLVNKIMVRKELPTPKREGEGEEPPLDLVEPSWSRPAPWSRPPPASGMYS